MEKPWKLEGFGNLPGSMLAIYRAVLAPLGGYVGPSWRLRWPILEFSSTMFSLCWHILYMGCMEELADAKTMGKT